MKKVYLAGPDVFKSNAKEIGESLKKLCEDVGLKGMYPLDNEIPKPKTNDNYSLQRLGSEIAKANVNLIHECDYVLANLEPFRGPSADCGTVWECAYAKGLGKLVVGYYPGVVLSSYKDKVINVLPHDGMMVEDFGTWDNIMLVNGIDMMFKNTLDGLEWLSAQEDK